MRKAYIHLKFKNDTVGPIPLTKTGTPILVNQELLLTLQNRLTAFEFWADQVNTNWDTCIDKVTLHLLHLVQDTIQRIQGWQFPFSRHLAHQVFESVLCNTINSAMPLVLWETLDQKLSVMLEIYFTDSSDTDYQQHFCYSVETDSVSACLEQKDKPENKCSVITFLSTDQFDYTRCLQAVKLMTGWKLVTTDVFNSTANMETIARDLLFNFNEQSVDYVPNIKLIRHKGIYDGPGNQL